ncbi:MAG: D-Ala-D-Ala carboxypeptidase family metallohydrolase [Telluria sp.]
MISLADYFMGRDRTYAAAMTPAITQAATEMVRRANALLDQFHCANPKAHLRSVNSGWRPPALNARIANAAAKSKHMTGHAIDIGDDDGQLDEWLMTVPGQAALVKIGLWMEHPSATPRWSHLQSIPPGSGRRVFHP